MLCAALVCQASPLATLVVTPAFLLLFLGSAVVGPGDYRGRLLTKGLIKSTWSVFNLTVQFDCDIRGNF
jgi:hypothetical protein